MAAGGVNGPIYPPIDPTEHIHSWQCPGVVIVPAPGGIGGLLYPLYCSCGDVRVRIAPEPEAAPYSNKRQLHLARGGMT